MKIKALFFVVVVLVVSLSFGAFALTSIVIDREVAAGTVLSDTDDNVVVKFTAGTNYANVLNETAGKVSFDLSELLVSTAAGFNVEAQFQIGDSTNEVFSITNNSNVGVVVTLANPSGGISLVGTSIIASGVSQDYYFSIDTAGKTVSEAISGIIQVRKQ